MALYTYAGSTWFRIGESAKARSLKPNCVEFSFEIIFVTINQGMPDFNLSSFLSGFFLQSSPLHDAICSIGIQRRVAKITTELWGTPQGCRRWIRSSCLRHKITCFDSAPVNKSCFGKVFLSRGRDLICTLQGDSPFSVWAVSQLVAATFVTAGGQPRKKDIRSARLF